MWRGIVTGFRRAQTEYELYHIPSGYKRTLIAGDIHVPFHSVEAVTKCIEYAKERADWTRFYLMEIYLIFIGYRSSRRIR